MAVRNTVSTDGASKVYRQNLTVVKLQDAAVVTGNGTKLSVGVGNFVLIQVVGITTATIAFEATYDDTNYVALPVTNISTDVIATTTTADGIFRGYVPGLTGVRARISAYTAGTITAKGCVYCTPL